jgi:hypothetical protein
LSGSPLDGRQFDAAAPLAEGGGVRGLQLAAALLGLELEDALDGSALLVMEAGCVVHVFLAQLHLLLGHRVELTPSGLAVDPSDLEDLLLQRLQFPCFQFEAFVS